MKLYLLFAFLLPFLVFADDTQDLTQRAESQDPQAQYELALTLSRDLNNKDSQNNAAYWYQQAAQAGHREATFQFAKTLTKQQKPTTEFKLALTLLTGLAIQGDEQALVAIGEMYENTSRSPLPLDMAELWYQIASTGNEEATERYNLVLEKQFNLRKAKQVSSLNQLDSAFESSVVVPSLATFAATEKGGAIKSYQLSLGLLFIALLVGAIIFNKSKQLKAKKIEGSQRQIHIELETKDATIKQQKRQIENLFKQFKKLQASSQTTPINNSLALACAMFGFHNEDRIPDIKVIKHRFKQLSKIYHPDMGGSDDDMKRLNSALKIIITHVK